MSFLCIPVAFSKHRLHSLAHKAYDDQIHGHSWSLISTSYEHPHLNQTNLSICIIHLPTRMHFALSYFQDIASFFFFFNCLSFLINVDNVSNTPIWGKPLSWSHNHPFQPLSFVLLCDLPLWVCAHLYYSTLLNTVSCLLYHVTMSFLWALPGHWPCGWIITVH